MKKLLHYRKTDVASATVSVAPYGLALRLTF